MLPSSEVQVTLEFPDGQVLSGKAHMVEVSMDHGFVPMLGPSLGGSNTIQPYAKMAPTRWEMTLSGVGNLVNSQELAEQVVKEAANVETWACAFCGVDNARTERKCGECGAARSFLFDLVEMIMI